jgi:hypothetical protein
MPLFVCDECGCVENTALGFYWGKGHIKFKDEEKNDKALCSECMPKEFSDGSIYEKAGKWHDIFKKEKWDGEEEVINR